MMRAMISVMPVAPSPRVGPAIHPVSVVASSSGATTHTQSQAAGQTEHRYKLKGTPGQATTVLAEGRAPAAPCA